MTAGSYSSLSSSKAHVYYIVLIVKPSESPDSVGCVCVCICGWHFCLLEVFWEEEMSRNQRTFILLV